MTALTPQGLREYLIGAWTLESYQSSAGEFRQII